MAASPIVSAALNKVSCKFVEKALSNYLVLRKILGFLSNDDLESCCQVNKFWESIAGPMHIRYYDIELKRAHPDGYFLYDDTINECDTVVIKKRVATKDQETLECSFPNACNFLEDALKGENIHISLHMIHHFESIDMEPVNGFLSKFGQFVKEFAPSNDVATSSLCCLLARQFPNLKNLDLSHCTLHSEPAAHPSQLHSHLQHLKTIRFERFGESDHDLDSIVTVLSIAPNLQKICSFPLLLTEALSRTQKGFCVKSLTYPRQLRSQDEGLVELMTVERALEKFAQLEPKLSTFTFRVPPVFPQDFLYSARLQPFIKGILESSHVTLEELTLYPSETFNFQDIPPMISLTRIQFVLSQEFYDNKVFSPDVNLQQLFPNVSVLKFSGFKSQSIATYFPEELFSPWGSQIQELQMKQIYEMNATAEILTALSKSFPSVKNVQFTVESLPKDLKPILPVIVEQWPTLEHLAVEIEVCGCCTGGAIHQQSTFDSLFTGFSDKIIAQLQDPLLRMNFTPEEMNNLFEASVIRKLPRLKTLEFDFVVCTATNHAIFMEQFGTLTSVSKEFGFEVLPELKVFIRGGYPERKLVQISG